MRVSAIWTTFSPLNARPIDSNAWQGAAKSKRAGVLWSSANVNGSQQSRVYRAFRVECRNIYPGKMRAINAIQQPPLFESTLVEFHKRARCVTLSKYAKRRYVECMHPVTMLLQYRRRYYSPASGIKFFASLFSVSSEIHAIEITHVGSRGARFARVINECDKRVIV